MTWQIEQECPRCGAPLTLGETDRLLACPFCRTRLFLAAAGHFRYTLPPAAGAGGPFTYFPYWRLRGAAFAIAASGVTHRFVDTNLLAVPFCGPPASLGVRPQVLKLRFARPEAEGRFIAPTLPVERAIPALEPPGAGTRRGFIGETVSLIHAPFLLRGGALVDAIGGRSASPCDGDALAGLSEAAPADSRVNFVPALCPRCGWDLAGEGDALVLLCRNCESAWSCPGDTFEPAAFTVAPLPPGAAGIALYLPFWRMRPRVEGMELATHADLIRAANLPKTVTAARLAAPVEFRAPAFKINPALYFRWARQMTVFRPEVGDSARLPESDLHPVTLPLSEAAEGMVVTLAQLIAGGRAPGARLDGVRISLADARLEYHPFVRNGSELCHPGLGVSLSRAALAHGLRM